MAHGHRVLKTGLRYWLKDAGRISNDEIRNPRLSAALTLAILAQEIDNWSCLYSNCLMGLRGLSCQQKKISITNK